MTPCRNFGASGPEIEMRRREESETSPVVGGGAEGAGEARDAADENLRAAAVRQLAHTKKLLDCAGRARRSESKRLTGRMIWFRLGL